MQILVGDTLYFSATDGSSGNELWAHQPGEITSLGGGAGSGAGSGSGSGMTNVTGATCTVSPSLPTGLSIDSNTCTISGTPTVETSNTTYTVTAVISGTTFQTTVWLSSAYQQLTPSIEGAELTVGQAMTNITFQYGTSAASGSTSSTCIGTACMVKDINASGNSFGTNGWPPFMETIGNTLYFSADDGIYGHNLWKSDGTASGTVMVKDINPGSGESFTYTPAVKPVVMNNELYFNANDGINGYELWKSDGTASGTVMVKDINSGGSSSSPKYLAVVGNTLYF